MNKNYAIILENVHKRFWIPEQVVGFFNRLKNLFFKQKIDKHIIKGLSFKIKKGEIIGFIGENGAGKSTTIKMLTGIYPPSEGKIKCLGKDPFEDRINYVKNIGVVFGNRSLLNFDIAPRYSLNLFASIYGLDLQKARKRYTNFAKRLKAEHLLDVPVRKLSLGERMKFEIIASLLHKPKIIYLDEPTIGLDLIAREELLEFLNELHRKEKTTIFLTTHNMDDIEELCNRIIIIDAGQLVYDGSLKKLKSKYADWKRITIEFSKKLGDFRHHLQVIDKDTDYLILKCPNNKLKDTLNKILDAFEIIDLKIEEPELKEIVRKIYIDKIV